MTVAHLRRLLRALLIVASIVPPALVIEQIVSQGVNVPFVDQWETSYDLALNTLDGTLTFDQVVAFHNEHRILFTNLVTVVSVRFFEWNLYLELFVTVALAFGLFGLIIWLIHRDFPDLVFALIVPGSALVFSLRGGHTWMTSFQSCFLWATLFFLLGLWALRRRKPGWLPLATAAAFAFCSTFSLASGVLAWALLGVGLPLLGYRKWRYLLFWVAAAAVCLVLYYAQRPNAHIEFTLASLPRAFEYTLVYLSGIFMSFTDDAAMHSLLVPLALLSIVLFAADAAYLWRRGRALQRLTSWLLIAGYAAATAALTGLGRLFLTVGFPDQALSERYTIIAVFWWISLIVLGAAAVQTALRQHTNRRRDRLVVAINLLAFAAVVPLYVHASAAHASEVHTVSPGSETCYGQYLITQNTSLPCLPVSRMDRPDDWLPKIDVLSARRLAMFNTPALDILLDQLPFDVLQTGVPAPAYTTYFGDDGLNSRPVFFEHTPALVEYTLTLPDWYTRAEFTASLYIDLSNVLKDPGTLQDGAIFSVSTIGVDGSARRSDVVLFDPHANSEPLSFAYDLSDFIGQTVRLQLQTESRESVAYDWALWIDPTIRLYD